MACRAVVRQPPDLGESTGVRNADCGLGERKRSTGVRNADCGLRKGSNGMRKWSGSDEMSSLIFGILIFRICFGFRASDFEF